MCLTAEYYCNTCYTDAQAGCKHCQLPCATRRSHFAYWQVVVPSESGLCQVVPALSQLLSSHTLIEAMADPESAESLPMNKLLCEGRACCTPHGSYL